MSSSFLAIYNVRLGNDLESNRLPFENRPPLFFLDLAIRNRTTQRSLQSLHSGDQQLYRLATCHHFLGYP